MSDSIYPVRLLQVSSEMLNLTICDVMTNFIADTPEQVQSTDWLMKIIRYLTALLLKQDSPVGQNARVIVRVLDRLCRNGFLAGLQIVLNYLLGHKSC